MSIQVQLQNFAGPLDLLLHLIKTNEMDIYDIQMVEITEQYLHVIEQMKQLDLDVAGEFLLMAATLLHIKSRMLLPVSEDLDEEEGEDPRAELVRRLLEYQRYKEVAELLAEFPLLDRDIYASSFVPTELFDEADDEVSVGVFQLTEAFHRILQSAPTEVFHEVIREQLSVAEHVQLVLERLTGKKRISFREIFNAPSKQELIVTFLATLELVKMRMIKVEQANEFGEIWLSLAVDEDELEQVPLQEEGLGYA
ncbi:condensin subunit ScpA [Malonomonas rubra DSM 5091]|uniref:Segregation and condensation protein A n=1 Tax=Malonomonas rubra DSM 5091 TaxID=1122189 RepID=A0A1M6DM36_MALRU|nr:segregation/condensation protein A [Malonomonas rubra]SHI74191.1 condensin subunit ScpA [Malonomonas rubra DSM 5091]